MEKESYQNAYDVLPDHLVKEIQRYYTGRLWVPVESTFFKDRNRLILELRANGETTKSIAKLVNLTDERVRQIITTQSTQI